MHENGQRAESAPVLMTLMTLMTLVAPLAHNFRLFFSIGPSSSTSGVSSTSTSLLPPSTLRQAPTLRCTTSNISRASSTTPPSPGLNMTALTNMRINSLSNWALLTMALGGTYSGVLGSSTAPPDPPGLLVPAGESEDAAAATCFAPAAIAF